MVALQRIKKSAEIPDPARSVENLLYILWLYQLLRGTMLESAVALCNHNELWKSHLIRRRCRLPNFRFDAVIGIVRSAKAFLRMEGGVTRGPVPGDRQQELARKLGTARQRIRKQREALERKNGEISRLKKDLRAAPKKESPFENSSRKHTAPVNRDRVVGNALPDFLIIGAQKCGTLSLYNLLGEHPHIRRSRRKEVHFFDHNFDKGLDWYRSYFPPSELKNGQRTISGEATPLYIAHSLVPERAAKVVPHAKLISLLRNPMDRAYSHYHKSLRNGSETLSFEDAIEAEDERLRDQRESILENEGYYLAIPGRHSYLARGVYVDQLMEWSKFFDRDQMLMLKAEDFFTDPANTFGTVRDFLGLPKWEPAVFPVMNQGGYTERMKPETREKLQAYFEPHNRRLYEYLGRDLGW